MGALNWSLMILRDRSLSESYTSDRCCFSSRATWSTFLPTPAGNFFTNNDLFKAVIAILVIATHFHMHLLSNIALSLLLQHYHYQKTVQM